MNRRMMRQAQELQKRMVKLQQELEEGTVEATSGGGVVRVVVNGKMRLESISIDPEAVDPDDVEILQDLVMAAVNEGIEMSQKTAAERMSALTGGLNIPGLT